MYLLHSVCLYRDEGSGFAISFLSVPHTLFIKTEEMNRRVNCIIYNSTAVRGIHDIILNHLFLFCTRYTSFRKKLLQYFTLSGTFTVHNTAIIVTVLSDSPWMSKQSGPIFLLVFVRMMLPVYVTCITKLLLVSTTVIIQTQYL